MLTSRARYALKALIHLARHHGTGTIQAASIARDEAVPARFLEAILVQLRRQGLVRSRPGKGGGHELGRAASGITLLEVIRAIDGPVAPLPCLSATAYRRCADCPDENGCGTRRLLHRVHHASLGLLSSVTIADALADPDPFLTTCAGSSTPAAIPQETCHDHLH